ncbi:MAG: DUF1697 domain-containing protein [Alkalinema sp. RU_4_3]|nr:DUF1697 domain-containing protein [Alkalinema sp. RU_4_3]
MPKHIAFLRAINVGGRYIKMNELAEYFERLGYQGVETFINTGNVIFESSAESTVKLAEEIEAGIAPLLGFKSETFVRTGAELEAILAVAADLTPQATAGEVNVAFLNAPLTELQEANLMALASKVDEFLVKGTEVYWICQVAQNASKFSNGVFEQKLKMRSTFRRVSMLTQLSAALVDA